VDYKHLVNKSNFIIPNTSVTDDFERDLIIVLRPWNSSDFSKVVVDEVTQYLSATQADLELTTPFQFIEGLSSLANKLRISALLANDRLYKAENRELYSCGFEMALLYRRNSELAWLSVGGFEFEAEFKDFKKNINTCGEIIDHNNFLPPHLLGIERNPVVHAGSIKIEELQSIRINSYFNKNDTLWTCTVTNFNS
jgi:hypothetical protein